MALRGSSQHGSSRAPLAVTWDPKFTTRRTRAYAVEDLETEHIRPGPGEDPVDKFWTAVPRFCSHALEEFLAKADRNVLLQTGVSNTNAANIPSTGTTTPTLATAINPIEEPRILIDDRRESTSVLGVVHDWNAGIYRDRPLAGTDIFYWPMDCRSLNQRLREHRKNPYSQSSIDRKPNESERRIIYIQDLQPSDALVLVTNVTRGNAEGLRNFLQRHLTNRVYLSFKTSINFTFEFHFSYFALRESGVVNTDTRHRRKSRSISPLDRTGKRHGVIHQAQVSLLILGIDEWFWTSYCLADTYFQTEDSVSVMSTKRLDGPSGGKSFSDLPKWNPREYFLMITAFRLHDITQEWSNLWSVFSERLEEYDLRFRDEETMRKTFSDDKDFSNTIKYEWIANTLKMLHNSLQDLINGWDEFSASALQVFYRSESEVLENFARPDVARIEQDMVELRSFERSINQRISMFENLRDSLVNASSLEESRGATRQNEDIGRLTKVTVLYLPLGFVTGVFSMSMVSGNTPWFLYAVVMAIMTTLTVVASFFDKIWAFIRRHMGKIKH